MRLAYDIVPPPGDKEQNLPPVILLHGMLDSRKTWKYIAPQIAELTGRKVYAVDARNHGTSPWSEEFSFDIVARDLDDFMIYHNIRKAALVGHSMGGRTALTQALKKPEKVEKLIVEDMNVRNFQPTNTGPIMHLIKLLQESVQQIPPEVDELTAKRIISNFMKPLLAGSHHSEASSSNYDMSMIPLTKKDGRFSWQANLNVLESFLTSEKIRQDLSGVYYGDALFIYGTKSFFKVEKDKRIMQLFPRALKLPFEGASHLIHFERPGKFVKEVSNFLNNYKNVKSKY